MHFLIDTACWPMVILENREHGSRFYFLKISNHFGGLHGYVKNVSA